MKNIISIYRSCLDFSGRSTRTDFCLFYLFVVLAFILAFMLAAMTQGIFGGTVHTVIFYIYIIGIVVPFPALVVRRLHDGGHSMALPISLVIFISVCCGLDKISASFVKGTTIDILCQRAILILFLGILAVFIALIVFLFIGKDKKDNKYGVSTSEIAILQRKLELLQKSIISNSTEETTCNRQ